MTNIILDRSEWLANGSRGFDKELVDVLDLVDGYVADATLPVIVEDKEYYSDSFCLQSLEDVKKHILESKNNLKVYAVDASSISTTDVTKVSIEDREALRVLTESINTIDLKIKKKKTESLAPSLSAAPVIEEVEAAEAVEDIEVTESGEEETTTPVSTPIETLEDLEAELSNAQLSFDSKHEEVYTALPKVSIYQIRLVLI
jgi:hypothetical protein